MKKQFTYITTLLVLSLVLILTSCKDDSKSGGDTIDLGEIQFKIDNLEWSASGTNVISSAGTLNDTSVAIITANKTPNQSLFIAGVRVGNSPKSTYSFVNFDLDESNFTSGGLFWFFDADGKWWISTSGTLIIDKYTDKVIQGSFNATVQLIEFGNEAPDFKTINNGKIKRLNETKSITNGVFNLEYQPIIGLDGIDFGDL